MWLAMNCDDRKTTTTAVDVVRQLFSRAVFRWEQKASAYSLCVSPEPRASGGSPCMGNDGDASNKL